MSLRANILLIDRHERKRFQIGSALDEAGHAVVDFAETRAVASAIFTLIQPGEVDIVLVGDVESGECRRLVQAEIVRDVYQRNIGAKVLGVSYNARPFFTGVPNFPILAPEDAHDLAFHITNLQLQTNYQ